MKRYIHRLDHTIPMTFNMGDVAPLTWFLRTANDTVKMRSDLLLRTQPLLSPTYHKIHVIQQTYFVPYRLLMNDWEKFRSQNKAGTDATVFPYISSATPVAVNSLLDLMGVPLGTVPNAAANINALPIRAYNAIVNKYVLDSNIQTPRVIDMGSGADTTTDITLARANWGLDDFTSASAYPQLGPAVSIPIEGSIPVVSGDLTTSGTLGITNAAGNPVAMSSGGALLGMDATAVDPTDVMYGDLEEAGLSIDVEDMRLSNAVQRWKEWMARFGGAENLMNFYRLFGVDPQDRRMQWPEYLGGARDVIQFSEVLQTAEGEDPVGELRGHGIGASRSRGFTYRCLEDGIIMTICVVRPETMYHQGLHKTFSMVSRYDFFNPNMDNLGQQPILNKEIYLAHSQPNGTFAFQDQNYHYRRIPNRVAGEFRPGQALGFWTETINYETEPAYNGEFLECVPAARIFAAGGATAQLQVKGRHRVKVKSLVRPKSNPLLK